MLLEQRQRGFRQADGAVIVHVHMTVCVFGGSLAERSGKEEEKKEEEGEKGGKEGGLVHTF